MDQEYEQDLARVRAACQSRDPDRIERTMTALDQKWTSVKGPFCVQLLRTACDESAAVGLRASGRGRALVERLAISALRKAGDKQLDTQLHLLTSYLRIDDKLGNLNANQRQQARKESAKLWLDVWKRIEGGIDAGWNPDDPKNHVKPYFPPANVVFDSGMSPEGISDPRARAEYEAHLKHNEQVSAKNNQQRRLRRLKQDYSGTVADYLIAIYSMAPFGKEELKEYLADVGDEAMKQRILKATPDGKP